MMFSKLKTATFSFLALGLISLSSCDKNGEITDPTDLGGTASDFHIAYFVQGEGSGNNTAYIQGVSDLTKGEITWKNYGFRIPGVVTTRFYSSTDGKTIYTLNYGDNIFSKFSYNGGQNYTKVGSELNGSIPFEGTEALRFTKLDEKFGSAQVVPKTASPSLIENATPTMDPAVAKIGILDFETMKVTSKNLDVKMDMGKELSAKGYSVFRIDAPIVSGNKIYYGCGLRKTDFATNKSESVTDRAFTLVLDYPALTNPVMVESKGIKGSTNGYRTSTSYKNEAGEILQMASSGQEVYIGKLKDGKYDDAYVFNLTAINSDIISSNGWFYAGNGIGYLPYKRKSDGFWGVARLDLNAKSLVILDLPKELELGEYQTSVAKDGKFYMAIAPKEKDGNIYIFDINNPSPNAHTVGAKITSAAKQFYIGLF